MNFIETKKFVRNFISRVHILYITRMPISYWGCPSFDITSIQHYFIFVGLQRSIGQPKV